MKVYLVEAFGGQWDYSWEYPIDVFLSKDLADKVANGLESVVDDVMEVYNRFDSRRIDLGLYYHDNKSITSDEWDELEQLISDEETLYNIKTNWMFDKYDLPCYYVRELEATML